MHAIVITQPGGPDVLQWQQVPDAHAAAGEVLVQVAASAVNRADLLQRQGSTTRRRRQPVPGPGVQRHDRGPGRRRHRLVGGRPCVALLSGGGYAELVAVPVGQLMPVPAGVDLTTAAALPEVACTVWSNVFMTAGLQPDETLLVHGGSSGIGTMAIQLAKAVGARVAVTAGSADKLERCRELGADIRVDYREEDFVAGVRDATDGHGADVVLDNMGAKYLARNVDVLASTAGSS